MTAVIPSSASAESRVISPRISSTGNTCSAVVASRVGRGTLVRMSDDPAFRAFWYGTDRLLLNALFFGDQVKRTRRFGR